MSSAQPSLAHSVPLGDPVTQSHGTLSHHANTGSKPMFRWDEETSVRIREEMSVKISAQQHHVASTSAVEKFSSQQASSMTIPEFKRKRPSDPAVSNLADSTSSSHIFSPVAADNNQGSTMLRDSAKIALTAPDESAEVPSSASVTTQTAASLPLICEVEGASGGDRVVDADAVVKIASVAVAFSSADEATAVPGVAGGDESKADAMLLGSNSDGIICSDASPTVSAVPTISSGTGIHTREFSQGNLPTIGHGGGGGDEALLASPTAAAAAQEGKDMPPGSSLTEVSSLQLSRKAQSLKMAIESDLYYEQQMQGGLGPTEEAAVASHDSLQSTAAMLVCDDDV